MKFIESSACLTVVIPHFYVSFRLLVLRLNLGETLSTQLSFDAAFGVWPRSMSQKIGAG